MAILRPNGDITVSLVCSTGTTHYVLVDESTLDTSDYVALTSSSTAVATSTGSDLLSLETFTRPTTIKKVIAYFNLGVSGGGGTTTASSYSFTVKLYKGTTELATLTTTSTGWQSITYTGDLTQAEIDDLRIYIYMSVTTGVTTVSTVNTYYAVTGYCYMAYVDVIPNQIITPTGITAAFAAGFPTLKLKITPTGIASLHAFGSPTVSLGGCIIPSGIASLEALGSPNVIMWVQIIAPPAVAPAFAVGIPSVIVGPVIKPSGIASAFVAGSPIFDQGRIRCIGIVSGVAFGAVMVLRDRIHLILSGAYATDSEEINRAYVVGQDLSGAAVTGSAITQAEVDLVGERLEVQHTPEATTAAVAGYVAANVISKARLGSKKAGITIPPHCGMELWDVINIYDDLANQSANYRVALYVFEYSVLQSRWHHQIDLCAP